MARVNSERKAACLVLRRSNRNQVRKRIRQDFCKKLTRQEQGRSGLRDDRRNSTRSAPILAAGAVR